MIFKPRFFLPAVLPFALAGCALFSGPARPQAAPAAAPAQVVQAAPAAQRQTPHREGGPPPTTRRFPYVGACMSDQPRLERIPGRVFDDFQGQSIQVPDFLAAQGFNAVRLLVNVTQPETTTAVDNAGDIDHRESNYLLDFGGRDWQVAAAKHAHSLGEKVVLTLQFGQERPLGADNWHEFIPDDWLGLNYAQTLAKIDGGTRQMLRPFLKAGVQPDILIVENESDSGMLFQIVKPDGKMALRDAKTTDPFSDAATGNFSVWPKCAGYYKQEILSAKSEMQQEGFDPARTRIAFHGSTSPGHTRFLFDNVFRNKPDAESVYYDGEKPRGVVTAVPASLRGVHLRDLIDIVGFSFYPDPPKDDTQAAFDASLKQMTDDLQYFDTILPGYGRYTDGPFRGQYKKQSLVIEFGVPTDASVGFTVARQKRFVTAFFNDLAQYPWTLGAMWWEPGYARNNWAHGEGSLYRVGQWDAKLSDYPQLTPVETIQTWGTFAQPRVPASGAGREAHR